MRHEEFQYLDLVEKILEHGEERTIGRNGSITKAIFGYTMRYTLTGGILPLLTTKKMFTRGVVEELLWFWSGSTDANILKERGVHIWDGHSSREFLDATGHCDKVEGDIGPGYGFQWRHAGAEYLGASVDYTGQGTDQIQQLLDGMKSDPYGRRHILCSWNVRDLPNMVLPPCHLLCQFYVSKDGGISCQLYQRSGDVGLGIPFNITSYSVLTHWVAKLMGSGYYAKEFIHTIGDAHIYVEHEDILREQLTREPLDFPTIEIKDNPTTASDFVVHGYEHRGPLKMKFIV